MVAKQDSGIPGPQILITIKKKYLNLPSLPTMTTKNKQLHVFHARYWFYVQMSEAKDALIIVFSHKFYTIGLLLLFIRNIGILIEEPSRCCGSLGTY